MSRRAALTALLVTLVACARAPETPDLVFPSEVIRVTGRSARPMEGLSVGELTPAPIVSTSPTLPIPSAMGVFTPVRASAEATPRLAALEPRLAAMLAREEARLSALTQAVESLRRLDMDVAATQGMSEAEIADHLSDQLLLWESGSSVQAELIWSPLGESRVSAPAQSMTQEDSPAEVPHLSPQVQEEMEEEAEQQAMENLQALLLETEIHPGVSLRAWLLDRGVNDREFARLLEESQVGRRDHWRDAERALHVCEVELRFDYSLLNSLR